LNTRDGRLQDMVPDASLRADVTRTIRSPGWRSGRDSSTSCLEGLLQGVEPSCRTAARPTHPYIAVETLQREAEAEEEEAPQLQVTSTSSADEDGIFECNGEASHLTQVRVPLKDSCK
jgi:hypothetical protein